MLYNLTIKEKIELVMPVFGKAQDHQPEADTIRRLQYQSSEKVIYNDAG